MFDFDQSDINVAVRFERVFDGPARADEVALTAAYLRQTESKLWLLPCTLAYRPPSMRTKICPGASPP